MSWWPGWDSIATAEWWENFYFWAGIACLFMLGASEAISHRYGLRKDALVAEEQRQTEQRHREDMARAHIRAPRTIDPSQWRQLVAYLSRAEGKGEVIVLAKKFDEEAEAFAKQVVAVLNEAGFDAKAGNGPMGFGSAGAWLVVRDLAGLNERPSAVGAIQGAFNEICGVFLDAVQRKDPFPDLGEAVIAIGANP